MEEDARLSSVNSSNKKVSDSDHRSVYGKNSFRSHKVRKSIPQSSFSSHLQKNLTKTEHVSEVRDNKNLSKIASQKELKQNSLLKSKRHLKELDFRIEKECILIPQDVQDFLKESFLLNLQRESFVALQICRFFDALISCLVLTSNENANLLRFFALNDKMCIFTHTWHMEITLNKSGKIKNVKISTSDKNFFDECSKATSKFRQIVNEHYYCIEEVDFLVSFENKTEESKTFSYKAYGCFNKNLDCAEIFEEKISKKLNLLI